MPPIIRRTIIVTITETWTITWPDGQETVWQETEEVVWPPEQARGDPLLSIPEGDEHDAADPMVEDAEDE